MLLAATSPAGLAVTPWSEEEDEKEAEARGLVTHTGAASPGYTLISPFSLDVSYLLDAEGQVVHQWQANYEPGLAPYLLPNGNLLRGIQLELPVVFEGGGSSGGIQEYSWEGELLWEFHLASNEFFHHHDLEPLPNGNLLLVAWEARSQEEALAMGREKKWAAERGLWPGVILELERSPPLGVRVVWEWHAWDHLVQDIDPDLPNYGVVSEHPERLDLNFDVTEPDEEGAADTTLSDSERAALEALGYLDAGGDDGSSESDEGDTDDEEEDLSNEERRKRERADWLHINGIDYNAELDQIAISSWTASEIWIIDHSTTTAEAASSSGGRSGRGGDLLYRWGNPQMYDCGSDEDRQLFHQHDVQWIPPGFPGEGYLTIFNNGRDRGEEEEEEYSTVLEIVPPLQAKGTYSIDIGSAFAPAEPVWKYDPPEDDRFFASFISGCHRLANGNTLICSGPDGRVFEVNPGAEIVWEYRNPFSTLERLNQGEDRSYSMFRATRIPPDHPGLGGRELAPLDPQPKTLRELMAELPAEGERSSGWHELFSEEDGLSQWVNVNCAERRTFELKENPDNDSETLLFCTGKPTGIMRSKRMYENFIVEFEWRHMEDNSNAGFFLWADPLPALGGPFTRGIEVQVCNLGNGDWFTSHGDIFPIWGATMTPDPAFRISGSRSMPKEEDFHANPTGEWNHYRITALDGAVELEVNGHRVTAGSNGSPSKGYLCIESEGGEIHFRDLKIWELPAGSHAADEGSTAREADAHRTLYNGLDLDDWEILEGAFAADDWQITSEPAPGALQAPLPEEARQLFFDFKRERTPTSGQLPFRLGEHRFAAVGEKLNKWNRVRVALVEQEITVEFAGQQQTAARTSDEKLDFVLLNEGVATEFCSIFASDEEN
jgi:hypothetical protein